MLCYDLYINYIIAIYKNSIIFYKNFSKVKFWPKEFFIWEFFCLIKYTYFSISRYLLKSKCPKIDHIKNILTLHPVSIDRKDWHSPYMGGSLYQCINVHYSII